jgi:Ca-activated chloride channel family protein
MKIDARLTFDKIRFDQDFDAHLVLSLTAPTVEQSEKRQAVCIIPVIDVSPSMQGEKMAYAKQSVLKLIDHLQAGDYCGLVEFSYSANVIAKPTKVTAASKDDLKRKVGDLRIGNATNIADALLTGLKLANDMDLPSEVITRVILFTDGQANTGVATRSADILKLVEPNLGLASVSAFGYGVDADQQLLASIAKNGKANYAFVRNPDDALSAFGKELGGLLSTHATGLVLEVTPLAGHRVTKIISDVEAEEDAIGGEVTIKIPDILGEETRHIVMGVKLSAQKNSLPRPVNIFDVKVGYDVLDPNSRKERKDADTKVKVQFVKQGEEQDKPDAELDKIVGLAEVVRSQIEAEELAKKGQFAAAQQVMRHTGQAVRKRGLTGQAALADNVGARLGSAQGYHDGASYLASVSRGGTRGMGVASYDLQAQAELQGIGVEVSNSTQSSTSASFAGGGAVHMAPPPGGAADFIGGALPSVLIGGPSPLPTVNPMDLSGGILGGSIVGLGLGVQSGSGGVGHIVSGSTGWSSGAVAGPIVPLMVVPPSAPSPSNQDQAEKPSKKSGKKVSQKKSSRW